MRQYSVSIYGFMMLPENSIHFVFTFFLFFLSIWTIFIYHLCVCVFNTMEAPLALNSDIVAASASIATKILWINRGTLALNTKHSPTVYHQKLNKKITRINGGGGDDSNDTFCKILNVQIHLDGVQVKYMLFCCFQQAISLRILFVGKKTNGKNYRHMENYKSRTFSLFFRLILTQSSVCEWVSNRIFRKRNKVSEQVKKKSASSYQR